MDSGPEAGAVEDGVLPAPTYTSQTILPLIIVRMNVKVKDGQQYLSWKEIECGWSCSNEFIYLGSLRGHSSTDVQELFEEPLCSFLQ